MPESATPNPESFGFDAHFLQSLLLNPEFLTPQKLLGDENFSKGIPNEIFFLGIQGVGKSSLCSLLHGLTVFDVIHEENTTTCVSPKDHGLRLPNMSSGMEAGGIYPKLYPIKRSATEDFTLVDCPGLNHQGVDALPYKIMQAFATQFLISSGHYTTNEKHMAGMRSAVIVLPFACCEIAGRGEHLFQAVEWANNVLGHNAIFCRGAVQFVISVRLQEGQHDLTPIRAKFKRGIDQLYAYYSKELYGLDEHDMPLTEENWHHIQEHEKKRYQSLLIKNANALYARKLKQEEIFSKSSTEATNKHIEEQLNTLTNNYNKQKQNLSLLGFLNNADCLHFFPIRSFPDSETIEQSPAFLQLQKEQAILRETLYQCFSNARGIPIEEVDLFRGSNIPERQEVIQQAASFLTKTLNTFSQNMAFLRQTKQQQLLCQNLTGLMDNYHHHFFEPWLQCNENPETLNQLNILMIEELVALKERIQHYDEIFRSLKSDISFFSDPELFPVVSDGALKNVTVIQHTPQYSAHPGTFELSYQPQKTDRLTDVVAICNDQDYSAPLRAEIESRLESLHSKSVGNWDAHFDLTNIKTLRFSKEDTWSISIIFKRPRHTLPEYTDIYSQLTKILFYWQTESRYLQELKEKNTATKLDQDHLQSIQTKIQTLQSFLLNYFEAEVPSCQVLQLNVGTASRYVRTAAKAVGATVFSVGVAAIGFFLPPLGLIIVGGIGLSLIISAGGTIAIIKRAGEFGPYPLTFLRDIPLDELSVQTVGDAKIERPQWEEDGLHVHYTIGAIQKLLQAESLGIKICIPRYALPLIRTYLDDTQLELDKYATLIVQYDGLWQSLRAWILRLEQHIEALTKPDTKQEKEIRVAILKELQEHITYLNQSVLEKRHLIEIFDRAMQEQCGTDKSYLQLIEVLCTLLLTLQHTALNWLSSPTYTDDLLFIRPESTSSMASVNQYLNVHRRGARHSSIVSPGARHSAVMSPLETAFRTPSTPSVAAAHVPYVPQINYNDLSILHSLGEGGFGKVSLALYHQKKVAVKFVLQSVIESTDQTMLIEEFLKEVNIMAEFHHPHIVRIIGRCAQEITVSRENRITKDVVNIEINDYIVPGIVMEFMEQGALCDVLDQHKHPTPLSEAKILRYAQGMLRGLIFLHASGYVDRDLKSSNILIDAQDNAKIADLGSTRRHQSQPTKTDEQRGTLLWRAPEIMALDQATYEPSADLYSIGIILWEMIFRELPYYDTSLDDLSLKKAIIRADLRPTITEAPPSATVVSDLTPVTYRGYVHLMTMFWNKDPTKRPNAAEGLNYLATIHEHETPSL